MSQSYVKQSEMIWTPAGEYASNEQLQTGCLQRIAFSVETIAKNWTSLVKENQSLEASNSWLRQQADITQRKMHRLELENKRLKKQVGK